jgi:hypothetical protein
VDVTGESGSGGLAVSMALSDDASFSHGICLLTMKIGFAAEL